MVTDAEERAAIAEQARFRELGDQLQDAVRSRSINYWQDRMVSTTVDTEFLAISWSGDLEYKMARTFEKAVTRTRKAHFPGEGSSERARRSVAYQMRDSYRTRQARRYSEEYYVFYKTSELIPETLTKIAPTLVPAFHAAALHHYFIITRHQQVAERDEVVSYTAWAVLDPAVRTPRELLDQFLDLIFPKKVPECRKRCDDKWWWIFLLGLAILITALAAGLWWYGQSAPAPADGPAAAPVQTNSSVPPAQQPDTNAAERLDGLETRIDQMDQSVTGLEFRIDQLSESIAIGTPAAPDAVAEPVLVSESNAAANALPGRVQAAGLDLPPCLPVRESAGRQIPAYLFMAVLSDAGIATIPREDAVHDLTGYQAELPYLGRTVSAAEFRSGTQSLFARSQAEGCRHYVLLMDRDPSDAAAYIAMRQAVEDHFYIYRLGR